MLIITPSLECGGAERYVSEVCNTIDKTQFDVTLLIVNNAKLFYAIETEVKIIDLKKKKVSFAILAILKFIKQNNFDIVYTTANHLNLLLAIFKRFIPKATKLIAWETSIVSINSKYSSYPKIYNFLLKRFYKKIPLVICQSHFMRKDLIDKYGFKEQQTKVIYTSIKKPTTEIDICQNNIPVFLTVARLSHEKQIDKIIDALSLLNFDYTYLIIGDGQEREYLEQKVLELKLNNKVIFKGQLSNPYQNIQQANLFLMASKYEGLPTTLIEATSYGIPVIAFNSPGGISEIIEEGINGFLVGENNVESYAKCIVKALSHNFNKESIINNTLNKFNSIEAIQKLETVFFNAIT